MNGERKTVEIPRLVEPTFQPQKLQMCGEQKRHEGVSTSAGNAASGWECLMCETCVELDKRSSITALIKSNIIDQKLNDAADRLIKKMEEKRAALDPSAEPGRLSWRDIHPLLTIDQPSGRSGSPDLARLGPAGDLRLLLGRPSWRPLSSRSLASFP